MEWCGRSDDGDLVVPQDWEPLDRLPSPDSWSQWGMSTFGGSEFTQKYSNGESYSDEVGVDISGQGREYSNNSSISPGLNSGSLQWTSLSQDQSGYQLNDQARIDQMDDIFLSSLLEEDLTSTDNLHRSPSFSPYSPQYSTMSADNLLTDMDIESSQLLTNLSYSMGSSKYLKTNDFSPPVDGENGETTTPAVKESVVKVSVPSEQEVEEGYMDEYASPEESVLYELERVTELFTEKTRTCFRDALYRLAENSKQQTFLRSQNGELISENNHLSMVHDETARFDNTELAESRANAIDRTIANLMFNKMDFSPHHHPAEASFNYSQGATKRRRQLKHELSRPCISHCSNLTVLAGDAEVPIVCKDDLQMPTANRHTDFYGNAVKSYQFPNAVVIN